MEVVGQPIVAHHRDGSAVELLAGRDHTAGMARSPPLPAPDLSGLPAAVSALQVSVSSLNLLVVASPAPQASAGYNRPFRLQAVKVRQW